MSAEHLNYEPPKPRANRGRRIVQIVLYVLVAIPFLGLAISAGSTALHSYQWKMAHKRRLAAAIAIQARVMNYCDAPTTVVHEEDPSEQSFTDSSRPGHECISIQTAPFAHLTANQQLRLYAGQPDPNDISHFTIAYTIDARPGILDGWLQSNDSVRLTVRGGPQN